MPLPDPRKLTAQRIARTEAYAAKIQKMFSQTVNELLSLPLSKADVGGGAMYSFDAETERTRRKVEQLLRRLQAAATLSIQKGVTAEWEEANKAADAIIKSQFSKTALSSPYMKGWNARNLEAMRQFVNRSDTGMNLSDRVWQSCRQLRDEMEVALTISIGEGEDAGTISRRVRQYLNDPDLMFRRFRYKDEDGRWQRKWKKRVSDPDRPGRYKFIDYDKDTYKDQWTGRGYYKSSAQNAMRVARTETNIAYRRADHARWQGLDFVLGQRVILSRNHPEVDICDRLSAPNKQEYDADDKRGLYPKDFVFDGWHPQCFCFVVPVMVAPEEMAKMNEAFVKGEDYTPKGEPVTEYPDEFKGWVRDNATKIKEAQKRGTEPYFIRNNAEVVEGIIKAKLVSAQPANVIPTNSNLHQLSETALNNEFNKIRKKLIRQNNEQMIITTPKGAIVRSLIGDTRSVNFDDNIASLARNNIVVHNHPSGKGENGIKRFGYSLSRDDVFEAIKCNMRGIIAESPIYRYYIMRPEKGWGVDAEIIKQRYVELYSEIKATYRESIKNHKAENIIQHLVMKKLSSEYGFEYGYKHI